MEKLTLNVALLRRKVPNLTSAAKAIGLRPATVSNLCTGKIPVERAELRTIASLAALAQCTIDDLILKGEKVDMLETGIKVLDVFAPLAKGGTVGLVARPDMGQLVLLSELFFRIQQQKGKTMLLLPKGELSGIEDVFNYTDIIVNSIDEAYEQVSQLAEKRVLAFASDRSYVVTGEILDFQARLAEVGIADLTTFLVDLKGEVVDEDLPYGPLETLWSFDSDLAGRHKFPAINPFHSTSSVLENIQLDQNHINIRMEALKVLRRYRELRAIVQYRGIDKIPSLELETYRRGERLESYLTQPFYVAEKFTGRKGETVDLLSALQDIRKIINNKEENHTPENLAYIGDLKGLS